MDEMLGGAIPAGLVAGKVAEYQCSAGEGGQAEEYGEEGDAEAQAKGVGEVAGGYGEQAGGDVAADVEDSVGFSAMIRWNVCADEGEASELAEALADSCEECRDYEGGRMRDGDGGDEADHRQGR